MGGDTGSGLRSGSEDPTREGTLDDDSVQASAEVEARPKIRQPTRIGHLLVVEQIGAGAMGRVYLAYDPQLDRKVAVKLIRSERVDSTRAEQRRLRLLREAQAMAKLSHPNVAAVYEAGTFDGDVFVAMEFVEGGTLKQWLAAASRGWEEVVEVFTQAGEGLAAAHEAGLVHRDFKPDNVLVGTDGRVRVVDFGLARMADEVLLTVPDPMQLGSDTLRTPLTQTGTVMGTPAYMSPEQFSAMSPDARSDQFSFCVALFEALHGARPFAGRSAGELASAVLAGEIVEDRIDRRVPDRVRRVVRRGLSPDPAQRHASMRALLAELRPPTTTAPRTSGWRALAFAGVALTGVALGGFLLREPDAQLCTGGTDEIGQVWSDARRTRLRDAMVQTGVVYAADTFERVAQHLDGYAGAWADEHHAACMASVRHEQSAQSLDLRMACLDDRKRALDAALGVLERPDAESIEKAISVATGLPPLRACDDAARLRERAGAVDPPPPDIAETVDALRGELARAHALEDAGRYAEGLELADAVVESARELEYAPLFAQARVQLGNLQVFTGDYEAARENLGEAYWSAGAIPDDELAAQASTELAYLLASRLGRPEDARPWARHAQMAVERGAQNTQVHAKMLNVRGIVEQKAGELDVALESQTEALELWTQLRGENDPEVANVANNIAIVLSEQGAYEQADTWYARALDIYRRAYGPDHPRVTTVRYNIGASYFDKGEYQKAEKLYLEALAYFERAYGEEHHRVIACLQNLGAARLEQGRLDDAMQDFARAQRLAERALGPEHPVLSSILEARGAVLLRQGDTEGALASMQQSLSILETALGPDHADLAFPLGNLGSLHAELGELDQARALAERALEIRREKLGNDHLYVAKSLNTVAKILREAGELEPAVERLREAEKIGTASQPDSHPTVLTARSLLGEILVERRRFDEAVAVLEKVTASGESLDDAQRGRARFALARAHWATGQRDLARSGASTAVTELERAGDDSAADADAARAWLTKHAR